MSNSDLKLMLVLANDSQVTKLFIKIYDMYKHEADARRTPEEGEK